MGDNSLETHLINPSPVLLVTPPSLSAAPWAPLCKVCALPMRFACTAVALPVCCGCREEPVLCACSKQEENPFKGLFKGCLKIPPSYNAFQTNDLLFHKFSFGLLPSPLCCNKSPETHCGLGPRCRPNGNTPKWFNRKGNSYSNGMVPYSFPRIIIKFMSPAKELYWVSQRYSLCSHCR